VRPPWQVNRTALGVDFLVLPDSEIVGFAPIPVDSWAGKTSGRMSDLEDGLELDRGELAEAALAAPAVIGAFYPVDDL